MIALTKLGRSGVNRMSALTSLSAAALLALLFLCSGSAGVADPRSVEYVSTSPGHYVEYLSLISLGTTFRAFLSRSAFRSLLPAD
jgi:hypothetical protein